LWFEITKMLIAAGARVAEISIDIWRRRNSAAAGGVVL